MCNFAKNILSKCSSYAIGSCPFLASTQSILFVHRGVKLTPELINHERIHTAQMLEMAVIGFYLWYIAEWLVRLLRRGDAYRALSFEQEAYDHQHDLTYLKRRKPYAWLRKREKNSR